MSCSLQMPLQKMLRLICLISIVLNIAACSKTNELGSLQNDFYNYKHSNYVSANLKQQMTNQKLLHNQTKSTQASARMLKNLNATKHKLTNRKKQASSRLGNVITNNGLYTPKRAFNKQLIALTGRKKSLENWLQNHSSLSAVLTVALKNNLDILSNKQSAQAALAKYDQVGFLDDMLAQYATFTKDLQLSGSTQKHNKSSRTDFPFPGLLALKASIIDQAVESSRLQLKQTVQDVITQTRIAYYELQFANKEISIAIKNKRLLETLKQQIKDNYSVYSSGNKLDLASILEVDIKIDKNHNTLQVAKQKQQSQQARLNALMNLSPLFTLGKLDRLKIAKSLENTDTLLNKAKQNRVEIARLQTDIKKMERIIQLSEKRFYPDFSAGYSRFQSRGSKQQFTTKPKIKNSNFFAKNDAYLTETKLKYKALQSKLKALQTKTEDDIQQELSRYKSQKHTYALYQSKVIPKAKATLSIVKDLYETGETSYLEVIDAEKMILKYRLLSFKAVKEMNVSSSRVMRFVGMNKI